MLQGNAGAAAGLTGLPYRIYEWQKSSDYSWGLAASLAGDPDKTGALIGVA